VSYTLAAFSTVAGIQPQLPKCLLSENETGNFGYDLISYTALCVSTEKINGKEKQINSDK
jgi:hypothetical protein